MTLAVERGKSLRPFKYMYRSFKIISLQVHFASTWGSHYVHIREVIS